MFLLRAVSIWRYGALFGQDSSLAIYPVWKAVHHLPVYEWPLAYPFSLSLYNYLFYYTYAFFLRLVGASGADIMMWGRFLTPVFPVIGAISQWKLIQHHLNLSGARSAFSLFFALGLWFCTSIVRHWALCMRPDIGAVALVMAALYVVVRQPRYGFALAGILFFLAWSFKQTVVLTFVSVCLFLLLQKRWRDLVVLASVFAALITAALLLGTPEYRYDILVAPGLVREFSFTWASRMAPKSLISNAYWILAPIALLIVATGRRMDNTVRLLTLVLFVALAGGLAGMTKLGAWDNYLLEAFVAGSTLLQIAVFASPGPWVNALVMYGCIIPSIQLATLPSGHELHTFGTVEISTPAEYADAVALRDRLFLMKKPIFSTDPMFSLPWISNDNQSPALVIDSIFHDATRNRCQNGCIEGMLQRGEVATVVLASSGDIFQSSLGARYLKVGETRESGRMWSIYELRPQTSLFDLQIRK
ncbi:MAG: hypothetical protein WAK26_01940 [Terracidiphilus sp.]